MCPIRCLPCESRVDPIIFPSPVPESSSKSRPVLPFAVMLKILFSKLLFKASIVGLPEFEMPNCALSISE